MGRTFTRESAPDKTCTHCGAIYSVKIFNAPYKDNDSHTCRCGTLLDQWRSTSIPEYTLKVPGKV